MSLEIRPITARAAAKIIMEKHGGISVMTTDADDFAIMVGEDKPIGVAGAQWMSHGVIMMHADSTRCSLRHLYTDGTALVGSILYGAAWRAAKALGYKSIVI